MSVQRCGMMSAGLLLLAGCSQGVAEPLADHGGQSEAQRSSAVEVSVDPQQALYDESRALRTAARREEALQLVDTLALSGEEREKTLAAYERQAEAMNAISAYRRQHRGLRTRDLAGRAERGDRELAESLRHASPGLLTETVRGVLGAEKFARYLEVRQRMATLTRSQRTELAVQARVGEGVVR